MMCCWRAVVSPVHGTGGGSLQSRIWPRAFAVAKYPAASPERVLGAFLRVARRLLKFSLLFSLLLRRYNRIEGTWRASWDPLLSSG